MHLLGYSGFFEVVFGAVYFGIVEAVALLCPVLHNQKEFHLHDSHQAEEEWSMAPA